jgi:hypothetical protein
LNRVGITATKKQHAARLRSAASWSTGNLGATAQKKPRMVRGSERLITHLSGLAGLVLAGERDSNIYCKYIFLNII